MFYMYIMPYTEDKHATLFIIKSWEHDEKNQLTKGGTCSSKKKKEREMRKTSVFNERSLSYVLLQEENKMQNIAENTPSI